MARRKYSSKKRMSKIEPAVQTITLDMSNPYTPVAGLHKYYVDLSQVASLVNRRFYRQGINWAVAGIKVIATAPFSMNVAKLPNTWVMSNAWEKGFRAWQRMNDMALEESPSVKPRFLDFKVYANSFHHVNGYVGNQLPISVENDKALPGEWEPSSIKIPYTDNSPGNIADRELIAVGGNYTGVGASGKNAVSLIEGYANSRGLPNVADPNTPDDAADADGISPENWMSALFNEGTNQDDRVLGDMITENNIAPYPFENDGVNTDTMYPGGANQMTGLQIHDIASITPTTIGGITRLKGGNFPCGLMEFNITAAEAPSMLVQIDLMPGNHRGYLCEPMTEM
ncbi:MAG: hypothetical protein [Circular genetic element sp.]|nr:MAG: hypothetical protein [Circular genetic element sp.]